MPLLARVVTFIASAGIPTGTFNVTHPDLTSPDCGILFGSGASTTDGTRIIHGVVALGVFHGLAQQGAIVNRALGQVGSTDARRDVSYSNVARYLEFVGSAGPTGELQVTGLVPGGVELSYVGEFTRDAAMSLLLIEGAPQCDLNDSVNFNGGAVNLGWQPDLLISCGTTGSGNSTAGKGFLGFCCRRPGGVEQAAIGWEARDNRANVANVAGAETDYFALRINNGSYFNRYRISQITATGYSFGGGQANLTDQFVFALQFPAGQQARCGLFGVQPTLGAQTIPVTYDAAPADTEAALLARVGATAPTPSGPVSNDTVSFGMVDSTLGQSAYAYCDDDGNPTSQSESLLRVGTVIDAVEGGSGTMQKRAACTSLASGIALDVTGTDADVNQTLWLAIQGTGVAPGDDAEVDLPREQLTLTARAPTVDAKDYAEIALPREQLFLRGRTPTTTVPGGDDITLPRGPLDLIPRAPGTRTSELVDSTLPREQLTLTARAPGVVAEAEANVQLGRVPLTLTARAPLVVSGADAVISLPRMPLNLTPRAPEISADDDEVSTLPAARLLSRASAPLIYLAGDKNTALPSARLKASAMFVRVRTTEPSEDDDPSGGIASRPASEVYSTPASPRIG